jgi:hypothetical protein
MTILCSRDKAIETKKWKLAITHVFFEAALFMNLIVLTFYWGIIHQVEIDLYSGLGRFHMYAVHSFPAIAFLINFLNTDIVVYDGHMKGLSMFGLIYSSINAYNTITTGKPIYFFLTWEDYTSPLIVLGIYVTFVLVYKSVAELTRAIKPWMLKNVI